MFYAAKVTYFNPIDEDITTGHSIIVADNLIEATSKIVDEYSIIIDKEVCEDTIKTVTITEIGAEGNYLELTPDLYKLMTEGE